MMYGPHICSPKTEIKWEAGTHLDKDTFLLPANYTEPILSVDDDTLPKHITQLQ